MRLAVVLLALSLVLLTACSGSGMTTPPANDSGITAVTPTGDAGNAGWVRTFEADRPDDAKETVLEWDWQFGAGAVPSTASVASPEVVLAQPGVYQGSVRIRTSRGWNLPFEFSFMVFGKPTVTGFTLSPPEIRAGEYVEVTATANLPVDTWTFGQSSFFPSQVSPTIGFYVSDPGESDQLALPIMATNAAGDSEVFTATFPVAPRPPVLLGSGGDALIAATRAGDGWAMLTRNLNCANHICEPENRQLRISGESLPTSTGWSTEPFEPMSDALGEIEVAGIATTEGYLAILYTNDAQIWLATAAIPASGTPGAYAQRLIALWDRANPAGRPTLMSTGTHLLVTYTTIDKQMRTVMVRGSEAWNPEAWSESTIHPEVREPISRDFARRVDALGLAVSLRDGTRGLLNLSAGQSPELSDNWSLDALPLTEGELFGRGQEWLSLRAAVASEADGVYVATTSQRHPALVDWQESHVFDATEVELLAAAVLGDRIAFVDSTEFRQGFDWNSTFELYVSRIGNPRTTFDWSRRVVGGESFSRCGNTCHFASRCDGVELFPSTAGIMVVSSPYETQFQIRSDSRVRFLQVPWPE